MDRAAALARLNRRMLEQFSARTAGALRGALPLRLALPHLEPFLARNLEKEVRKDASVIRCAAEALATGRLPAAGAARDLLGAAREIDRQFLATIGRFPVRIEIPYERVEPVRLRRIERGLALSSRILGAWRAGSRVREAIPRAELERQLGELLQLYCAETAALSRALRLPGVLAPLRERFAQHLLRVMGDTAARLAQDIASHKAT